MIMNTNAFTNFTNIFNNMFKAMIGCKVTIKNAKETWNGEDFTYTDLTGILEESKVYTNNNGSKSFYFTVNSQTYDVTNMDFKFE